MQYPTPPFRTVAVVLAVLMLAASASAYEVGDWTVLQLTDNDVNDVYPRVSGNTVVWSGMGTTGHWQIFMWRDGVTTQITDNSLHNVQPRIDGDWVTWTDMARIHYYDGATHTLTPSYEIHFEPEVSQGALVWRGPGDTTAKQIYHFDGIDVARLTETADTKNDVRISGSTVVWWGGGVNNTGDIFYHDGTGVVNLTDDANYDKYPCITDGGAGDFHLTYESYVDGYWDIMHFDGTTTVNLTNTPGVSETVHRSCGDRTVWRAYHDGQYRIWLHDGTGAAPISPEGIYVNDPEVSGSLVVWWGGPSSDVYVYDGTDVTQLIDTYLMADLEPKVDGGVVVWHGSDGFDDEIFMAYKTGSLASVMPEAGSLTVHGASPNPFNPFTEVVFATTRTEALGVRIYDARGHLVADLGERIYAPGEHRVAWQGRNDRGQAVPSGVYFYLVEGERDRRMGTMSLVK